MKQGQPANPEPTLEARALTVLRGGHKVLEVDSFQVRSGEVVAIIGPNGSGKTTLLLALALLLKPAGGQLFYRGQPVAPGPAALQLRRKFAVVFQEPLLLEGSVWDNVTLGMRLRGLPKDEMKKRAKHWLERFGVAGLSSRRARTVSGGEAKRVSLARAFALEPEVLFLDEPFAALDTPTHQSIIEELESVLRETRVSTVLVTHDHDEALTLGHRIAVLMNGRIRQTGTPPEVFSAPGDEEVAGFVKAGNVMRGKVTEQNGGLVTVSVNSHHLEVVSGLPAGTDVTVYLHYEDVTISVIPREAPHTSARNRLRGRISRILPLGSQVRVTAECPFALAALITRRSFEELDLEVGMDVILSFKASAIRLLSRAI